MRRTLLLLLFSTACASSPASRDDRAFSTGDPRVGVYVSPARTFRTNSFFIEGPDGVVLIDTGFLPADGIRALERAERESGKRVVLAVVLHANPDKFNGTEALRSRGVRVITSSQVRALIPHVHEIRHRAFASRYPGEYPAQAPMPESFGDTTTRIDAAGTRLTLHVLGKGCSDAHVVLEWEGHVFVGDLVANRTHSWLELGHTDEWIERLREIERLSPRFVHPGRGASGGPELLRGEREYIERVVAIVREHALGVPLGPEGLATLQRAVEEAYPGYDFPVFLRIGLPAVAARTQNE